MAGPKAQPEAYASRPGTDRRPAVLASTRSREPVETIGKASLALRVTIKQMPARERIAIAAYLASLPPSHP
jgi:hypothetical protein